MSTWQAPGVAEGTTVPTAAPAPPVRRLLPVRPLAAGEVLDGSVTVTRAYPRAVLGVGAVLALVSAVVDLGVTLAFLGPLSSSSEELATDSEALRELVGAGAVSSVLGLLVGTVVGAVMAGVMSAVVGKALTGETASLRQTWDQLRPLAGRLVGLSLVVGLAVYGSLAVAVAVFVGLALTGTLGALLGLLVLAAGAGGAVLLYVRWSLAPAALVLEGAGLRTALSRSSVLVQRSFWRTFGVLLLALAITLVVAVVVQLPFQLLGYSPLDGLDSDYQLTRSDAVLGAVAGALSSTLVVPFAAGVRALLYVDRRMRAEGLDLVLLRR